MGIQFSLARDIARVVQGLSIGGLALTLGKQATFVTHGMIENILLQTSFASKDSDGLRLKHGAIVDKEFKATRGLSENKLHRERGCISDTFLFGALGLKVESIDISDYEGADYIYDLNVVKVPPQLVEKYDLICDIGTMEHIFHLPNVFTNLFNMLKIGGVVMHWVPSNNDVDHGFYQISPTLLCDYYLANNYEITQCKVVRVPIDYWSREPWMYAEYSPGCLDYLSYGKADDHGLATLFVARKTKESTAGEIPVQGLYRRMNGWKGNAI